MFLLMQIKLDQEKQKESMLAGGGKSLLQETETFSKLRADALKASTSEPSKPKEKASEGATYLYSPHIYLPRLSPSPLMKSVFVVLTSL